MYKQNMFSDREFMIALGALVLLVLVAVVLLRRSGRSRDDELDLTTTLMRLR